MRSIILPWFHCVVLELLLWFHLRLAIQPCRVEMKRAAVEQISATPLKRRLSLSLKSHFRSPINDVEAMEKAKGAVPKIRS